VESNVLCCRGGRQRHGRATFSLNPLHAVLADLVLPPLFLRIVVGQTFYSHGTPMCS
jgi:hypothetical protein